MSLFPLDNAEAHLRSFTNGLKRDGNVLRWPSHDGVTELAVRDIHENISDGRVVSELVTLTHISAALDGVPPAAAAELNKLAAMSALIPRGNSWLIPGSGHASGRLVSKAGVFDTDRAAAEHVYAPLLCMEAASIGWHAARLARGQFRIDPAQSPFSMTDQPPPFSAADFEAAKEFTDRRGYIGSLDGSHFTVEFPWEPGAQSKMFLNSAIRRLFPESTDDELDRAGGRTSLLQIFTTDHPLYGKGMQSQLEIPLPIERPSVIDLVNELNCWELSGAHLPPLFGAWFVGDRAPAFMSFIPTQLCFPGLLQNLTAWAVVRHARVGEWLNTKSSVQ